jgi:hypothetical protein
VRLLLLLRDPSSIDSSSSSLSGRQLEPSLTLTTKDHQIQCRVGVSGVGAQNRRNTRGWWRNLEGGGTVEEDEAKSPRSAGLLTRLRVTAERAGDEGMGKRGDDGRWDSR